MYYMKFVPNAIIKLSNLVRGKVAGRSGHALLVTLSSGGLLPFKVFTSILDYLIPLLLIQRCTVSDCPAVATKQMQECGCTMSDACELWDRHSTNTGKHTADSVMLAQDCMSRTLAVCACHSTYLKMASVVMKVFCADRTLLMSSAQVGGRGDEFEARGLFLSAACDRKHQIPLTFQTSRTTF